jgi:Flp pilus assembly secretin CpaC
LPKFFALAAASAISLGAAPPATAPASVAPPLVAPAPATPATAAPIAAAEAVKTAVPAPAPTLPKEFTIAIDQTQTLELDRPITTLSIGNPSIADVNIQNGNRIFLLGKSFGRTNVLALDSTGKTILDMTIFVTAASGGSVTVYKGARQITYNCAPKCERALMPGDSKEDFEALSGQISQKASMGSGSGGHE